MTLGLEYFNDYGKSGEDFAVFGIISSESFDIICGFFNIELI